MKSEQNSENLKEIFFVNENDPEYKFKTIADAIEYGDKQNNDYMVVFIA